MIKHRRGLKRILLLLTFCVVALALLLAAGFLRGLRRADATMSQLEGHWVLVHTRFCPSGSDNDATGPSWELSYEPRDFAITAPVTLSVGLSGRIHKQTTSYVKKPQSSPQPMQR
jgi:hypothetical protein